MWWNQYRKNISLFNIWCRKTWSMLSEVWKQNPFRTLDENLTKNDQSSKLTTWYHQFTKWKHWRETLKDTSIGKDFLEKNPRTGKKTTINKWDYNKQRNFCTLKETLNQVKRRGNWQNGTIYLQTKQLIKKWLFRIYKELKKLITKQII